MIIKTLFLILDMVIAAKLKTGILSRSKPLQFSRKENGEAVCGNITRKLQNSMSLWQVS
jgi:hypothetical protein